MIGCIRHPMEAVVGLSQLTLTQECQSLNVQAFCELVVKLWVV